METKYFTENHEWISVKEGVATVGITDYAQQQLGDVVFVELPEVGAQIQRGEEMVVIESVKAAGEIHSALEGKVTQVNESLVDDPERVNEEPEGQGWLFKLQMNDESQLTSLMSAERYAAMLESV
jgi:glycine cleavage system H protein